MTDPHACAAATVVADIRQATCGSVTRVIAIWFRVVMQLPLDPSEQPTCARCAQTAAGVADVGVGGVVASGAPDDAEGVQEARMRAMPAIARNFMGAFQAAFAVGRKMA